ncbi:MAG: cation diffusion facilitator family transporter [Xenococcaceae cyanobacterium]
MRYYFSRSKSFCLGAIAIMSNHHLEQRALQLSIWGALGMAGLGITFGMLTPSEAIMLDGFYNLISFVMAGASLWVSRQVRQPDDEYFQFGYAGFEPLVNLIKGLLIAILSLYALFSAIDVLFHGGRELNTGFAIQYAVIAASGCLIIAVIQTAIAKKTGSPMVQVDSKNWFINGVISLSVALAFLIVAFIQGTSLSGFVPYADSTIVTALVIMTFPIPIKIIIENLKQLLLGAPNCAVRQRVKALFEGAVEDLPWVKHWLRITQVGRQFYLHIYWLLPEEFQLTSVEQLDQIREKITAVFQQEYANLTVDIIFTQNAKWAGVMNPPRAGDR